MIDFATLSLFGTFLVGTGLIAWWATTLDKPKKPHHPAPGE